MQILRWNIFACLIALIYANQPLFSSLKTHMCRISVHNNWLAEDFSISEEHCCDRSRHRWIMTLWMWWACFPFARHRNNLNNLAHSNRIYTGTEKWNKQCPKRAMFKLKSEWHLSLFVFDSFSFVKEAPLWHC